MCRYAQFTLSSRQLNYRGFPLIFLNPLVTRYSAFAAPSFIVKKKNGYTILNPANGIFGFGHYPRLPTVYDYITT